MTAGYSEIAHRSSHALVCRSAPVPGALRRKAGGSGHGVRETENFDGDRGLLDFARTVRNNAHCCMPRKRSTRSKRLSRREVRELDVKISFLEGIVRRDSEYVEALQVLGDHYTQRGRVEHSLKVDQQLSRLEPQNPLVFYNLACSYALNSEFDAAATALEKALILGYRDFKWLARDPDLRRLRKHPIYRSIEDKIRRMKVKVR
jgi:hypothetical protein